MIKETNYYTYIIRCNDNSLYTGITTDLNRRFNEHFNKTEKCAKYTLKHQALKMEAAWISSSRVLASKLEYHIKKLPKIKKEILIKENNLEILEPKIEKSNYTKLNLLDYFK